MKIMITGGSGYIGKNLMKHLGDIDCSHFNYDLSLGHDILDERAVYRAMKGCDAVVHLAGIPGVTYCERNILETIDSHVYGTNNVVVSAKSLNLPLVFSSTIAAKTRHNVYGITKYLAELIVLRAERVVLRFTNVYGGISDTAHNAAVIEKFIKYKKNGIPADIFGDGEAKRDFVHVKDVCRAIVNGLGAQPGIYEVGTGEQTSIKELAEMIGVKYALTTKRVGDITEIEYSPDIQALGWKPDIKLKDGIKEMLK